MFNTLVNYFKDEEYSINISNNMIYVFNYIKILFVKENEISLSVKRMVVNIYGKELVISKLEKSEILIKGFVSKVELFNEK